MADKRKYYYLKLKESYFDDDAIVLLESMPDGILYSNILLKLYLKSLKNGGKLQLDEHIPYTAQMIATLTRQQIGTVERALEIFRQLGLVEQLDSGAFYMTDIELMIGQSSTEAERKRAARLENRALAQSRTNGGHLSDICPPEIEIEKEIDIEIEKEGERKTGQAPPAATADMKMYCFQIRSFPSCKQSCPTNGSFISTVFPAISHPPGRNTKTTPPPYADGRQPIPPGAPRNRVCPITPIRRDRAYDE